MIKITIDKSQATVAEIQDLDTMPSYQELILKLDRNGKELGIELDVIESDNTVVSPGITHSIVS
jgi:hypothetical protein